MTNVITFTVASSDAVIGWEIELEIDEIPTVKDAMARLVEMIGVYGIEKFIELALKEDKIIDVIIANNYGTEHLIEYDPAVYVDPEDTTKLFTEMLGICLEEFLVKGKDEAEEIN